MNSYLASNESFQAIARQTLELAKANAALPEDIPCADMSPTKVEGPYNQEGGEPLNNSVVQQAVRDGQLALPDGEVLLCRCLLHESMPDTPVGYTQQEIPSLIEQGPSKCTISKAEEQYSKERQLMHATFSELQIKRQSYAQASSADISRGSQALCAVYCLEQQRALNSNGGTGTFHTQ